jgi:uncharacterized RDD family membrane protein YckC
MWIDLMIQSTVAAAIVIGFALGGHTTLPQRGSAFARSVAIAVVIALTFLIFFGYFILFEALRNGRTPGKQMLGLRVVRDGGYPIDFGAAAIRNLIRVAEFTFGFYAVSAVATILSAQNKRLGDMAAGTIVVRDSRMATLAMLREDSEQPWRESLLLPQEQSIVDRFVARAPELDPEARRSLAGRIAARIRPHVPAEMQRLEDEELLRRLSAS